MNTAMRHSTPLRRQRGVNLIELMISLTISLVVLAGASVILVSANKSSRIQEDLVTMQENARFAIKQIADDLQSSGYYGCVEDSDPLDPAGPVINNVAVDVSDPEDGLFIPSHVRGYEHTSPATTPLTAESRDVLEIQYADLVDELSSDMTGLQSPVPVGDASQFAMDDIVMIANCEVADIFSVSGVSGNTLLHQTAATSGETMEFPNRSDSLSAWYTEDNYNGSKTEVFQFNRIKYYISHDHNADGDTDDPGEDVPALFRALNKTRDQIGEADELFMRGVDAFEVLYGEDTDGDTRPDAYVEADSVGTWGNITAVRFALLVRSENEYGSQADRSQDVIEDDTIDVLGTDFTAGEERVRRRLFQSTVFIRNSI